MIVVRKTWSFWICSETTSLNPSLQGYCPRNKIYPSSPIHCTREALKCTYDVRPVISNYTHVYLVRVGPHGSGSAKVFLFFSWLRLFKYCSCYSMFDAVHSTVHSTATAGLCPGRWRTLLYARAVVCTVRRSTSKYVSILLHTCIHQYYC